MRQSDGHALEAQSLPAAPPTATCPYRGHTVVGSSATCRDSDGRFAPNVEIMTHVTILAAQPPINKAETNVFKGSIFFFLRGRLSSVFCSILKTSRKQFSLKVFQTLSFNLQVFWKIQRPSKLFLVARPPSSSKDWEKIQER